LCHCGKITKMAWKERIKFLTVVEKEEEEVEGQKP
jgi:hypothetical protein